MSLNNDMSFKCRPIDSLVKMLPEHWRSNLSPLVSLAGRTYIPRLIETTRTLTTLAAVGHRGLHQLCAVALAKSIILASQVRILE
jgi:hypothetical protein